VRGDNTFLLEILSGFNLRGDGSGSRLCSVGTDCSSPLELRFASINDRVLLLGLRVVKSKLESLPSLVVEGVLESRNLSKEFELRTGFCKNSIKDSSLRWPVGGGSFSTGLNLSREVPPLETGSDINSKKSCFFLIGYW